MAPRKEKGEKTNADQGAVMVLEYLRKQKSVYGKRSSPFYCANGHRLASRPYSATDISAKLHNKVSKTHAARFLKEMHDQREIEGKSSGKQTVYHCLQDPAGAVPTNDLVQLDKTIADLRTTFADCKSTERSLKTEVGLLSSAISATDLRSTVEALQTQKEGLMERLTELKKTDFEPVPEAEKTAIKQAHKAWEKHASGRRRIFKDLWYKCVDHLPDGMTKAELWEELGWEGTMV